MLLKLTPEYRDYVWGGQRLRPGQLTAEAWVVYEGDRIATGPHAGRTLGELTATMGTALLGTSATQPGLGHFPLLIKLLDCAAWLSVQVHPNDEQAVQLEGPGHFGKTEAWHVLAATPEAQVIAGVKPGTTHATLATAIQQQQVLDCVTYHPTHAGDTIFMPAGTIHALGPGLLIYEVQQTSNITYRVFDWHRPASQGRPLHIAQSLAVTDPQRHGQLLPLPQLSAPTAHTLTQCPYFHLELLALAPTPLLSDTGGASFHALTAIEGMAEVQYGAERLTLQPFETVLLTADSGHYQLQAASTARVLRASVPTP